MPPALEPQPLPVGSETVLLAEDEPAVRNTNSAILRGQGYHVIEDPARFETAFRGE